MNIAGTPEQGKSDSFAELGGLAEGIDELNRQPVQMDVAAGLCCAPPTVLSVHQADEPLIRVAALFHPHRQHQEAFARERLLRILQGDPGEVIAGACRHLIRDRMERSGMRCTRQGVRVMLNLRAVWQSSCRAEFQQQETSITSNRLSPGQPVWKLWKSGYTS